MFMAILALVLANTTLTVNMYIFVADLAFLNTPELVFQAKVGILAASLFAGIFGYMWLRFVAKSA
jgi:NhaA family Na+:H+ antiporter